MVVPPRRRALCALAGLVAALGGCGLPASGPTTSAFLEASAGPSPSEQPFLLVEATGGVADRLAATVAGAQNFGRLAAAGGTAEQRIAVGDVVQVTLYEPTGGGLFSGGADTSAGGAARELPAQSVSAAGTLRIPFAGEVAVAGLSTTEAAARIEDRLEGQAIEPQALVVVEESAAAAVSVLGDAVAGGRRVPLTGSGERLLDAIAASGGLSKPLHETVVRLTRNGAAATVDADSLLALPDYNVVLRPRDVVAVEHRPRHFSVLGAANENDRIAFGQSRLSLAEALARARGLVDARADPAGVFLARYEDRALLADLPGVDPAALARLGGDPAPVIYRLDLERPEALLIAQRFPLRHQDVLYVSNSTSTPYEKLFRMVGLVLAPLNTLLVLDRLSE